MSTNINQAQLEAAITEADLRTETKINSVVSGYIYPIPQQGNTPANEPAPTKDGIYTVTVLDATYTNFGGIVVPNTTGIEYKIQVSDIEGTPVYTLLQNDVAANFSNTPTVDYIKFGKYTTANKNLIDVSDTSKVYIVFDSTLGRFEQCVDGVWSAISDEEALNLKADVSVTQSKNLFNKDKTSTTLVSGDSETTDNYGDVIIHDAASTGYNLGTWGIAYNQYNISISHKIPLSQTNNKAISNQSVSTSTQVLYFNASGVCIGITNSAVLATWFTDVDYVRFVFPTGNLASLQIEYGETSTDYVGFSAGTKKILKEQIPFAESYDGLDETLPVNGKIIKEAIDAIPAPEIPESVDVSNKADLDIYTKNLFNKNATKKTFVVDEESQTDTFGDKILVDCLTTGYHFPSWALKYNQYNINLTPPIPITEDIGNIISNQNPTTSTAVLYFNENNRIIKIEGSDTLATWYNEPTNGNLSYVRFSYPSSNEDTLMINYGTESLPYEDYDATKYLKEAQIPPTLVKKTELEVEIENKIISLFGDIPKLALPSKMYFLKDNNTLLYLKGIVHNKVLESDYEVLLSDISMTKKFDDLIIINTATATTVNNTISLYAINSLLDSKEVTFEVVESPTTAKTLEIWNSGDSITDLGNYQPELKRLLALDSITANFTGLMPNADKTIFADPLSGGDLGFIAEQGTDAMVLDVSGITERPQTGYPGTQYEDTNGNTWVVRGYKLTESGGTYSGKLKIGIFQVDPNYGDGGSSGTTPTAGFPANSTLTKTNSLDGDATISYTTVDVVNFNPYWNPNTNEIDFAWYKTYWGFADPDVLLLQFSYNDVSGGRQEINGTKITTAMTRAKAVIDQFLLDFPNAKVVFGTDPYGSEYPTFAGGQISNLERKYSTINFFRALVNTFDNATYEDKVYLVPLHAQFDHKTGFGNTTTETITVDSVNYIFTKLSNGFDGVHPSNNTIGWQYEAKAYRAVFNEIANNK